jgi:heterodisulfide reductase subunit A2
MAKTAIYICDCMGQISDPIDTASLEALARELEPDAHVQRVGTLCTSEDLQRLQQELREQGVERLLVAACSPRTSLKLPEQRLMAVARAGGVDPCLVEVANIREQCAWIHPDDRSGATAKARDMLRMTHARLSGAVESSPGVPVQRRALVLGGGPAGLAAAKHLARADVPVTLVEQQAHIGGGVCQLAFMFQTEAWPATCKGTCVGPVQAAEALFDERIELLTGAELQRIDKEQGNFTATVRLSPRFVDVDRCISCGQCTAACPVELDNTFELERGVKRKAIDKAFVRAVPDAVELLPEHCPDGCVACAEVCPNGAIDLQAAPQTLERAAGAVIMTTGTAQRDVPDLRTSPDVVTAMTFERMLDAGQVVRPSDGEEAEHVVFVQCAGSRAGMGSARSGVPYCSKTCCAVTAKQVKRLATNYPMVEASVVYYRDFRTYERALEQLNQDLHAMGIEFHNGEVTEIAPRTAAEGGGLSVQMDALGTEELEEQGAIKDLACDLVVLACAQEASLPAAALGLGFPVDAFGFPIEHQPRVLRPTETFVDRVYAAGSALGPKTIQQAVEQGKAAALKAIEALTAAARPPVRHLSIVDPQRCSRCGICASVCPHGAISLDETGGASADPGFCQGCGLCAASCPSHAANLRNFSDEQLLAEAAVAFTDAPPAEPKILALLCYWCSYAGADMSGIERHTAPTCFRTVRARCSSSVNMGLVLELFRTGIDGVIVAGCPHHSCHHMWGNWLADKRVAAMKQLLAQVGLDERRLIFENIGLMHGQEFVELIDRKRGELAVLGPNPLSVDAAPMARGGERAWLAR